MVDVGGQDATEAFEDVGHSDEAREVLEGLLIGTLKRGVSSIYHCEPFAHFLAFRTCTVALANEHPSIISFAILRYMSTACCQRSGMDTTRRLLNVLCEQLLIC